MAWNSSTILLIDPDDMAARELADLLQNRPQPPRVLVAPDVQSAEPMLRTETLDWIFIRIILWDDFQRLRALLPSTPRRVVFLSGRNEKCTAHLPLALDSHLQPPYRCGHLVRVWNKWMDAHFVPQPLDIFFIKSRARFEAVRYGDIRQVEVEFGKLRLQTRHAEFQVSGSLQAFQERLPISLALVRRGCLVNEFYWSGHHSVTGGPGGASSVRARW
jgi:DNA-binding LytR/AlgR family response regulator